MLTFHFHLRLHEVVVGEEHQSPIGLLIDAHLLDRPLAVDGGLAASDGLRDVHFAKREVLYLKRKE